MMIMGNQFVIYGLMFIDRGGMVSMFKITVFVPFPVKADGAKTDCASTDGNCPANAACSTTVCNCNTGWIDDGTGICTGMDNIHMELS